MDARPARLLCDLRRGDEGGLGRLIGQYQAMKCGRANSIGARQTEPIDPLVVRKRPLHV